MRKLLLSAAAATAAFVAVPAAAQGVYDPNYGRGYGSGSQQYNRTFDSELQQIAYRVRTMADQRQVSPREADRVLYQVDQLDRLSDRYRRNGVTQWEHRDLQQRLANLRERTRFALAGGRWDSEQYNDGRWDGQQYNDDRWDNRDDDDGRWDNDSEDNDDRWDDDDEGDDDWDGPDGDGSDD